MVLIGSYLEKIKIPDMYADVQGIERAKNLAGNDNVILDPLLPL